MSNNPFRGAFVMRSQEHHILTSTYFNNNDQNPYPETAKRIALDKNTDDPFEGTFDSVWLEEKELARRTLTIKKDSKKPFYILTWSDGDKKTCCGEAIKENGVLFGYYWGVRE